MCSLYFYQLIFSTHCKVKPVYKPVRKELLFNSIKCQTSSHALRLLQFVESYYSLQLYKKDSLKR